MYQRNNKGYNNGLLKGTDTARIKERKKIRYIQQSVVKFYPHFLRRYQLCLFRRPVLSGILSLSKLRPEFIEGGAVEWVNGQSMSLS